MFNTFRKHQRVLMLIIATLTILAFAFFYDYNRKGPGGSDEVGKIYGHPVRQVDAERSVRLFQLAIGLGQIDLVQALGWPARDKDEAVQEFIWNLEVLRHEAKQLGIEPTRDQIMQGIGALPAFQTDGRFDEVKFNTFMGTRLGSLGFTQIQVESLVADSLKLERLRQILSSQVAIGPSEVSQSLKVFQPVDMQVVRINLADAAKSVTPSEEEITRFYEENKVGFMTNPMRAVDYVKIDPPAGFAELKDKARLEALQKQTDVATAFQEKARAQGLDVAAKAAGYKVLSTPEFTMAGDVTVGNDTAKQLNFRDIAQEVFRLEAEGAVSDVIQGGDSFYVVVLKKVVPARPLALEEIRPAIQNKLKNDAARKAMEISAQSSLEKIRQAMKQGKSFADAAKELGLNAESINGIAPSPAADAQTKPDSDALNYAAATLFLNDGQMSGFEKSASGGFIVYLVKRQPAAAAVVDKEKPEIEKMAIQGKQMLLFIEWLRASREAANIVVAGRR